MYHPVLDLATKTSSSGAFVACGVTDDLASENFLISYGLYYARMTAWLSSVAGPPALPLPVRCVTYQRLLAQISVPCIIAYERMIEALDGGLRVGMGLPGSNATDVSP